MEVWKKCNQDENIGRARPLGTTNWQNLPVRTYAVENPTNTYYPQGKEGLEQCQCSVFNVVLMF